MYLRSLLCTLCLVSLSSCQTESEAPREVGLYTVENSKSYLKDYPAINADGTINVVIEIPAGTQAKWEVAKPNDNQIQWDFEKGRPRVVSYLPYPGNYGMVPRTILPKELGGDGDPLDVLVLGPSVPRGSVIPAHIIGVLRLKDRGEQDDKLIAVPTVSALKDVRSLDELDRDFPGITSIIETWFANYKRTKKGETLIAVEGYADVTYALTQLRNAIDGYEQAYIAAK